MELSARKPNPRHYGATSLWPTIKHIVQVLAMVQTSPLATGAIGRCATLRPGTDAWQGQCAGGFVPRLAEPALLRDLVRPLFAPDYEQLVMLGFDPLHRLRRAEYFHNGRTANLAWPTLALRALIAEPSVCTVWLAHNHPSDVALPSAADIEATQICARVLRRLDILLAEHVILTDAGSYSFRRAALL